MLDYIGLRVFGNIMKQNTLDNHLKNASTSDQEPLSSHLEDSKDTKQISIKVPDKSRRRKKTRRKTKHIDVQEITNHNQLIVSTKYSGTVIPSEKLNQPRILDTQFKIDPLADAKLRGLQLKYDFINESLDSSAIAKLLQTSIQIVDRERERGNLLAFTLDNHKFAYPAWQIQDGKTISGLNKVIKALSDHGYSVWTQVMFLTTGDIRLNGKTPLECLISGKTKKVLVAAQMYGEHSAA